MAGQTWNTGSSTSILGQNVTDLSQPWIMPGSSIFRFESKFVLCNSHSRVMDIFVFQAYWMSQHFIRMGDKVMSVIDS